MFTRLIKPLLAAIVMLTCFSMQSSAVSGSGWTIFRKLGSTRPEVLSACGPEIPAASDISGFLYNPASPGTTDSDSLQLLSENGAFEDTYGAVLFSKSVSASGRISAAAAYYDAGTEELFWVDNNALQSQTVNVQRDMLGVVSFENRFTRRFFAGVSLKYATSRLAEQQTAQAYAADMGTSYIPWKNGMVSLAVQNIGDATAFIREKDPLPQAVLAGMGHTISLKKMYVSAAISETSYYGGGNTDSLSAAGLELGTEHVAINAGVKTQNPSHMDKLQTHLGITIAYRNFSFGYAYITGSDLDAVQRISVGYRFAQAAPEYLHSSSSSRQLPVLDIKPAANKPIESIPTGNSSIGNKPVIKRPTKRVVR